MSPSIQNLLHTDWEQIGQNLLYGVLQIAVTLILARLIYSGVVYLLKRLLGLHTKHELFLNARKAKTLFPLLRSVAFYVISFAVLLQILKNVFDFDTSTLLASAGVLGVAIGFGAQSLVKDVIGGFFILFEDQFSVGEYISAGNYTGTVEEIGLRATKIRDPGGQLHVIPNGSISVVTNYNRGKMRALVDVPIAYHEDIDRIMNIMVQAGEELKKEFSDKMVEPPQVQGVIQLGETRAVLRMVAYAKAGEQWFIEREYRLRVYKGMKEAGIPPLEESES